MPTAPAPVGFIPSIPRPFVPILPFAEQDDSFGQPTPALPRFTEFYCQSGGSNLNGGSDNANAARFTSTNGNWSTVTNIFTPTDGTNPVSAGVTTDQFASVYIDGASVAVYIARVIAVQNAANGAITLSTTAVAGSAPTTSATTRTIKVGGAWLGPNAASGFPLSLTPFTATNPIGDHIRINFKNDATYSITSGISPGALSNCTIQGYTANPGDGGKATFDFGTTTGNFIIDSSSHVTYADLVLASSSTTSTGNGLLFTAGGSTAIRVVAHGWRSAGLGVSSASVLSAIFIECEAYDNNKSNTAALGGFYLDDTGQSKLVRCFSHDNTGSNTAGFHVTTRPLGAFFTQCISSTNGGVGFNRGISANGGTFIYQNCDAYNNTSDGIKLPVDTSGTMTWIENCNFTKNGGKGINNTAANQFAQGFVYNCGYGGGTEANRGGDSTLAGLQESSPVFYAPGVTPYKAPATGDFSIVLASAISAGRGAFTQTDGTHTGTVGYPDIGAALANAITQSQAWQNGSFQLPSGYVTHSYIYTWQFASGAAFTLLSGTLPPGLALLTLSSASASIAGTPTTIGSYTFVIRATVGTSTGDATFGITILGDPDEGIGGLLGGLRPTC